VPAPTADTIQQKKAKQRALVPAIDMTRFYHARTCVQISKAEIEDILADPERAPDSDDEEDVEDWKVSRNIRHVICPLICTYLYGIGCLLWAQLYLSCTAPQCLSSGVEYLKAYQELR